MVYVREQDTTGYDVRCTGGRSTSQDHPRTSTKGHMIMMRTNCLFDTPSYHVLPLYLCLGPCPSLSYAYAYAHAYAYYYRADCDVRIIDGW